MANNSVDLIKSDDFLVNYITERGMQNIGKSEYEQILFYWMLKKEKVFGDKDFEKLTATELYEISDNLGLDISKVKSLVKKMPFIRDKNKNKMNDNISDIIFEKLDNALFSKADKFIHISIENPIEFDLVKRMLAENNDLYDTSFSSNVLKISFDSLSKILKKNQLEDFLEKMKNSISKYEKELGSSSELKELLENLNKETKTDRIVNNICNILTTVSNIAGNVIIPLFK